MKLVKFFSLILVFLVSLSVTKTYAQALSGDSYEKALATKKASITVVYLLEDAFAFKDEKGVVTGVEGDIFSHFVNWLKNSKGIELNIKYIEEPAFSSFYSMVQKGNGGVIGLGTVTILERRKSEVKFSPPFINNIAVLATHSSVPTLSSLSAMSTEFKNMKGIAGKGTTLETYLVDMTKKYHPTAKLEYLASQTEVAAKVAADPNYFSYMDLSIYWPAVSKQKQPLKRHPAGDLASETFGFIMPLNSDWEPVIKEFFNIGTGYRSTSAYRGILIKHLGAEVTKMLEIARTTSTQN